MIQAQQQFFILEVTNLPQISGLVMRALIFAKQKLATEEAMIVVGAFSDVKALSDAEEFSEELIFAKLFFYYPPSFFAKKEGVDF